MQCAYVLLLDPSHTRGSDKNVTNQSHTLYQFTNEMSTSFQIDRFQCNITQIILGQLTSFRFVNFANHKNLIFQVWFIEIHLKSMMTTNWYWPFGSEKKNNQLSTECRECNEYNAIEELLQLLWASMSFALMIHSIVNKIAHNFGYDRLTTL